MLPFRCYNIRIKVATYQSTISLYPSQDHELSRPNISFCPPGIIPPLAEMDKSDIKALVWRWSHPDSYRNDVEYDIIQDRARREIFRMREEDIGEYKQVLDIFPEAARQDYLRWERLWDEVLQANEQQPFLPASGQPWHFYDHEPEPLEPHHWELGRLSLAALHAAHHI